MSSDGHISLILLIIKQQDTQVCKPQPDVNTGHIHSSIILLTEQVSDVQEKAVRI